MALYVTFPKSRWDLKGAGDVIGGKSAGYWSAGVGGGWGRGRYITRRVLEDAWKVYSPPLPPFLAELFDGVWLPGFLKTILRNGGGGDETRRKDTDGEDAALQENRKRSPRWGREPDFRRAFSEAPGGFPACSLLLML